MEIIYREAVPADAPAIIDFQIAMARETEDFELEREITTRGVHAVFADPALGRYFVAESDGRVVATVFAKRQGSDEGYAVPNGAVGDALGNLSTRGLRTACVER